MRLQYSRTVCFTKKLCQHYFPIMYYPVCVSLCVCVCVCVWYKPILINTLNYIVNTVIFLSVLFPVRVHGVIIVLLCKAEFTALLWFTHRQMTRCSPINHRVVQRWSKQQGPQDSILDSGRQAVCYVCAVCCIDCTFEQGRNIVMAGLSSDKADNNS